MPDYDYECKKCRHQFSAHMSIEDHEKEKIKCPKCGSKELKHLIEPVFVTTSRKS